MFGALLRVGNDPISLKYANPLDTQSSTFGSGPPEHAANETNITIGKVQRTGFS
jgi:hypothetical protein